MEFLRRWLNWYLWLAALCVPSAQLSAQAPQNMEDLTEHIAATADLPRPQRVFLAPMDGCLLEDRICEAFETAMKASLKNMLPAVRFVDREEIIATVKKLGFMGLDSYNGGVLGKTASEVRADILITETLKWVPDGYELTSEGFDVHKDESLIKLELKVPRSNSDSGDDPLILKDPESELSLIVMRGPESVFRAFQHLKCTDCPDPKYTEEARRGKIQGTVRLVLTVSEQGVPQDIRVAKSLDPGLDAAAVEAVGRWKLTPAVGLDGKPFAVRTHAEVTFRLL